MMKIKEVIEMLKTFDENAELAVKNGCVIHSVQDIKTVQVSKGYADEHDRICIIFKD